MDGSTDDLLIATLALRVNAGEMAVLLAAEYVPRVVVGLLAASWIDRVRRRPVLIMTNLARGVILAAVAFAASRDALTIELLYGVATALAAIDVVFLFLSRYETRFFDERKARRMRTIRTMRTIRPARKTVRAGILERKSIQPHRMR